MRLTSSALILSLVIFSPAGAAEPESIWQIGKADKDDREFAIAGDVTAFSRTFPGGVRYKVGSSTEAKDFPFIHPGPADDWAGRRTHAFNIVFDLPQVAPGAYELKIDLVDTHAGQAPVLRVGVNGQEATVHLEPGTGDVSLLRPERGKPRTLRFVFGMDRLRTGANTITLQVIQGSWLLYDAIALRRLGADPNPPMQITATASIFFVEREGKLLQEVRIAADGVVWERPVEVQVLSGAQRVGAGSIGKPTLGSVSGAILIEPTTSARPLTVNVACGEQISTLSITQQPQRLWRIYVAPATHTDIGYTDVQSKVIERHNRNTDLALELIRDYPLYHWNLESSWAAQVWFGGRPRELHERLYEASRQKRIGIESGYLNMLTGLCSDEELIRNLYYSARLARDYGIPFESHTLTDAPSHVWSVPSVLAGAGIRCLSIGINGTRAPILKKNIHHKSPFWWEGPDGQRVLTWFAVGYSQAGQIGLSEGAHRMRTAIERDLHQWNTRADYPFDAILLHGAYSDNVAIADDIPKSLAAYSKQYAYPRVILGANNDFFEYVEKNFGDKIPTVRGCGGSWWEDGAASSALETGVNRVAHQDILAAETAWAVAGVPSAGPLPQEAFNHVWDNILLYDEHTWGAWNSISEPTSDFVTRQWAVKAAYATTAAEGSLRLLDRGLRDLAARVTRSRPSRTGLLVFNPSGRARSGLVHARIPRSATVVHEGKVLDHQVVREDLLDMVEAVVVAPEVPSVGYITCDVVPAEKPATAAAKRFDGKVLENSYYRVTFAPDGAVSSIVDKAVGRELVDASKYKLGQLVYGAGGGVKGPDGRETTQVECPKPDEVKFSSPTTATIEAGAQGAVYSSARAISNMRFFPRIEMEVQLFEAIPRIDFVFRLRKQMTFDKEALYIAFPFAGANPKFRYEIGGASVRPNEDQFPGSCRDWFAVQRWVAVETDAGAVAWSPIDTPLITLCDTTPGRWLDELPITNGTIFAYVMNNYWFTNYKAGQDGEFTFRYSLTSDRSIDPVKASLFGESVAAPLRAVDMIPAAPVEPALPPVRSFCRVEPESVTLMALKRADDGKGVVLRVRNTSDQPVEARIAPALDGVSRASTCDLVERVREPLAMQDGQLRVKLRPFGMATVRLE